ncbi:transposable element Tcb1 transposase [Trichonephila clavipes]|nr:transposable element Tcb1 transposase [Trichonephila clavipes]
MPHLQTSMSSPGFEPGPYGTAVSFANHYTGWEGTTERRGRSHPPQCTTSLSVHIIRRRLQESGLSARRPLLGLPLTQNHRRLCYQWCNERLMWMAGWNEVAFTDESRICLQHLDSRIRVWRHLGERM